MIRPKTGKRNRMKTRKTEKRSKVSRSFQNLPVFPGFYTHRAVRDRVLAKAIQGETKTQIAREEGLSRPTVRKILNHPEMFECLEQARRKFISLNLNALRLIEKMIDENEDIDLATAVLITTGLLSKDVCPPPLPQQTRFVLGPSRSNMTQAQTLAIPHGRLNTPY